MGTANQRACIARASKLLEKVTPLGADCGKLCEKACCQGDDKTGMWLLPGEAELLGNIEGFNIQPCQDNTGFPLLVCDGKCIRKYRPFACRIYPFFPLVIEQEPGCQEVEIICDPRAGSCPLAQYSLLQKKDSEGIPELGVIGFYTVPVYRGGMTMEFRVKLRRAAHILLADREIRQYLLDTSRFLMEMAELRQKIGIVG